MVARSPMWASSPTGTTPRTRVHPTSPSTTHGAPADSNAAHLPGGRPLIYNGRPSCAENSSLNWKAQYSYIEDIHDGRGYTAGIIGFCSGIGDMLDLVQLYTNRKSGNVLAKYLPALRKVNGTSSHKGLDPNFTKDWKTAAKDS